MLTLLATKQVRGKAQGQGQPGHSSSQQQCLFYVFLGKRVIPRNSYLQPLTPEKKQKTKKTLLFELCSQLLTLGLNSKGPLVAYKQAGLASLGPYISIVSIHNQHHQAVFSQSPLGCLYYEWKGSDKSTDLVDHSGRTLFCLEHLFYDHATDCSRKTRALPATFLEGPEV
jgi:hypothetical protein